MPTLTKAASFSKKFLIILTIVLVAVIAYFSFRTIGKNMLQAIFPPPADPATIAFGKLPQLDLSEGIVPPPGITYKVETITGKLPELARQVKVFSVKQPVAAFGDTNKANSLADSLRFNLPPVVITTTQASYLDDKGKTLVIQLTTGELEIKSDYLNSQAVITRNPNPDKDSTKMANDFLTRINFDKTIFPEDKIQVVKYKVDNGELVPAVSLSGANLTQINYNRADIDKVPLVPPLLDMSKVRVLVGAEDVVSANFAITNIEKYRFSTYPLKGINKAYEDLVAGKAIINDEIEGSTFPIREVSLGYLETQKNALYLQPVYIFKSDEGLAAFVPAVRDEYVDTSARS